MKGIFGFVNKKTGKVGGRGSPFRIFRILLLFLLFTGVVCLLAPKSLAAFPQEINFQGKLTDDSNIPVADSTYSILFGIYNVASGGSPLWFETQAVTTESGFFNVLLGSVTPIDPEDFDGSDRWLGIKVGADSEMTPRHKLVSVGYAFHAYNADMVDGLHASEIGGLSTADADARYVNITGDSMTGTLTVDVSVNHAISGSTSAYSTDDESPDTWPAGVYGETTADGAISPEFHLGVGVYGVAKTGDGPYKVGVVGLSTSGFGVYAKSTSGTAVQGESDGGHGVVGQSNDGDGVRGSSDNGYGVRSQGDAKVDGDLEVIGNVNITGVVTAAAYYGDGSQLSGIGGITGDFVKLGTTEIQTTGNEYAIQVKTTNGSGKGVYGEASAGGSALNYGGYFTAAGNGGRGVYGEASASGSALNYGGYFTAAGSSGKGVYAEATADEGIGVFGYASATGESANMGGYFRASGKSGRGVHGIASNDLGVTNYGGYFQAYGDAGRGVYGVASGSSGRGVHGVTHGSSASGVYGEASASSATGVYGYASSFSGTNYGVYGKTNSDNGYSGYFVGGKGVSIETDCYVGGDLTIAGTIEGASPVKVKDGMLVTGTITADAFVGDGSGLWGVVGGGISTADADARYVNVTGDAMTGTLTVNVGAANGVSGKTSATEGGYYGVYGESASDTGYGIMGKATEATGTNYGGHFTASGTAARAVYGYADSGSGTTYGIYAQTKSSDGYAGYFKGGKGVSIETDCYVGGDLTIAGTIEGASPVNVTGGMLVSGTVTADAFVGDGSGLWGVVDGGISTADADARYVNVTGDSMTGTLTVDGEVEITGTVTAAAYYGDGSGLWGVVGGGISTADADARYVRLGPGTVQATDEEKAIWVKSDHASGYGVYGEASDSGDTTNYGGYFTASGQSGRGVQGYAPATGDFENYGGYFVARGERGRGVYGFASANTGTNYGVYGTTDSSGGYGVYGVGPACGGSFEAYATSGTNYGVYGKSNSTDGYAGYFTGGKGVSIEGDLYVTGNFNAGALDADTLDGLDSTAFVRLSPPSAQETISEYGVRVGTSHGSGKAVYGYAAGDAGYGVYGIAPGTSGKGVCGIANSTSESTNYGGHFTAAGTTGIGVYGVASGYSSMGVYGKSSGTTGKGVYGESLGSSGAGLYGHSPGDFGKGVYGYASSLSGTNYGVYGKTDSSDGYAGYFEGGKGVSIEGDCYVTGEVYAGTGGTRYGYLGGADYSVYGYSTENNNTIFGKNNSGSITDATTAALAGYGYSGNGIIGYTRNSPARAGVVGIHSLFTYPTTVPSIPDYTYIGVYGESTLPTGHAIYGNASSNTGTNYGVYGKTVSTTGFGVYGLSSATNKFGYLGGGDYGAYGQYSSANKGYIGGSNFGVSAEGTTYGVYASGGTTGVYGIDSDSGSYGRLGSGSYGVYGDGTNGVYGSGSNRGIFGYSASGDAGYFNGSVTVTGTLSKGGGSFQIDHPIDPENKVLRHSFVESPDMKNIYDGMAVLDEKGEAVVEMPDYFEALNKDFRYQLTCIGKYQPVFIQQEIKDNKFVISGGAPGMKVSWQVTGTRHDAFAMKNPVIVEEGKDNKKLMKGAYIHPDAFGKDEIYGNEYLKDAGHRARILKERGIFYAHKSLVNLSQDGNLVTIQAEIPALVLGEIKVIIDRDIAAYLKDTNYQVAFSGEEQAKIEVIDKKTDYFIVAVESKEEFSDAEEYPFSVKMTVRSDKAYEIAELEDKHNQAEGVPISMLQP